jgi:hypothetical protein
VGGVWDDTRLADAADAADAELTVVRCTDGSAGGSRRWPAVGRIAFVGRGHDPGGGWLWAVKFGPTGYVATYADALAALRRRAG